MISKNVNGRNVKQGERIIYNNKKGRRKENKEEIKMDNKRRATKEKMCKKKKWKNKPNLKIKKKIH